MQGLGPAPPVFGPLQGAPAFAYAAPPYGANAYGAMPQYYGAYNAPQYPSVYSASPYANAYANPYPPAYPSPYGTPYGSAYASPYAGPYGYAPQPQPVYAPYYNAGATYTYSAPSSPQVVQGGVSAAEALAPAAPAKKKDKTDRILKLLIAGSLIVAVGLLVYAIATRPKEAKKIVLRKSADGSEEDVLAVAEIEAFDQHGKKLTLSELGTVEMSSTHSERTPATNAVDENLATNAETAASDAAPSLTYEFDRPQKVSKLTVYGRQDCCLDRLAGAMLVVYDDRGNKLLSQRLSAERQQTFKVAKYLF